MPWPRTSTAARPSSSRSRASRAGRCRRDANGGSTRTRPGTRCDPCRAASPSGPNDAHGDAVGGPVAAPGGHQRGDDPPPLAGRAGRAGAGRSRAPADGRPGVAQHGRAAGAARVGHGQLRRSAGSPRRTEVSPSRRNERARTGPASATSTRDEEDQGRATSRRPVPDGASRRRTTTAAATASSPQPPGQRHGLSAGPGRRRARPRARRRG